MTHAPETSAINRVDSIFSWCLFLVRVSCTYGTGFVWFQILAPITALFYSIHSRTESGGACDWNDHLWFISFQLTFGYNIRYNNSRRLGKSIVVQQALFLAPEIFTPEGSKKRHWKPVPKMESLNGYPASNRSEQQWHCDICCAHHYA